MSQDKFAQLAADAAYPLSYTCTAECSSDLSLLRDLFLHLFDAYRTHTSAQKIKPFKGADATESLYIQNCIASIIMITLLYVTLSDKLETRR